MLNDRKRKILQIIIEDYIETAEPVVTENDRALINSWYKERIRNMDDIFKSTAKILSRMTQNVSLVLANKKSTARFKYLKFLPLSDTQARYG